MIEPEENKTDKIDKKESESEESLLWRRIELEILRKMQQFKDPFDY